MKKFNFSMNPRTFKNLSTEVNSRYDTRVMDHPERIGEYYYTMKLKSHKEDQYYALYRRKTGEKNYQLIFDPRGDKAVPQRYLGCHTISGMSLSDSANYLATMIDMESNELPTGFIKNLSSNKLLSDRLPNCAKIEFMEDEEAVLYVKKDAS